MTENEKYIYDHFLISIKSGFESLEDIIAGAIEAVEDEGWQREISEDWIRETLTREYELNEAASKTWVKNTDPERLLKVFDTLCAQNILAVHNVGYTDSEAIYDIEDIWQDLEDEGAQPKGFCYYHGQDLERAIETGELMLGFGGKKEKNEKEAIAIGNIITSVFQDAGFDVEWNHTATERIKILDFNWQNAFTSYEEVEEKWGHDKVFTLMM